MTENHKLKHKKFVSIVLYFRKSIIDLIDFLDCIEAIFSNKFEHYEYIIVNNHPDLTLKLKLQDHFTAGIKGDLSIINLSWNHNIEDAMKAGIELSIGDLVFEFDSILIDYDPKLLMHAYDACVAGYEMVTVAPTKERKRSSRVFYKTLGIFSNDLHLITETFRLVSRKMINMSSKTNEVFSYRKANYQFTGLKSKLIKYTPLVNKKTQRGSSLFIRLSLATNILIYYSSIGTRVSLFLSLFFLLMSILAGVYVIISFIINQNSIQEGWSSIMLFLSLSFCGLFGILALISKYVEVLLKETKSISPYTYRSIEKFNLNAEKEIKESMDEKQ